MEKKQEFAKGIYFEKRENSPEFVIGNISIKVAEFISTLKKNEKNSGYVNIDVLKSKREDGHPYCVINSYVKEKENKEEAVETNTENETELVSDTDVIEYPDEQINIEDIPF